METQTISFGNWIPDINRYGLPVPPEWFLKAMWDMDAGLVILPSRGTRKYLVARRRDKSLASFRIVEKVIEAAQKKHKRTPYLDSDLLESNKLVGVDVISGNVYGGTWNPSMLAGLRDRDMWAAGGADEYIKKIEAAEEKERIDKRVSVLDDIEYRAKDAWRSYQARTGQRNQHAKDRRRGQKKSPFQPSGSTAGSGSGIVITG